MNKILESPILPKKLFNENQKLDNVLNRDYMNDNNNISDNNSSSPNIKNQNSKSHMRDIETISKVTKKLSVMKLL